MLHDRTAALRSEGDRRQDAVRPIVERRLSPMARRVAANKAAALRLGGERPMGSDASVDRAA